MDLKYREFGQLIGPITLRDPKNNITLPGENDHFRPHKHQIALPNYVNPRSHNLRLFNRGDTGTGKTLMFWMCIKPYINFGKTPIIILGFDNTKEVFINDAIKYPEIGFVSHEEFNLYMDAKRRFFRTRNMETDFVEYRNMYNRLRGRIANKGQIKFYGYQEFANRVGFTDDDVTEDNVKINNAFVTGCNNSVIIADEIHQTYNSVEMNSRGRALKYILDNCHVVFVGGSATPANNLPSEYIELAKFLNHGPLKRSDYFHNEKLVNEEGFKRLFAGKISVVKATETYLYPEKKWAWNSSKLADIDPKMFRFVKCQMSKEHAEIAASVDKNIPDDEAEAVTRSSYFARDFVFPDRNGKLIFDTYDLMNNYGTVIPNEFLGKSLKKYSAKYAQFVEDLPYLNGKVLLFHPRIRYGTKLIEQILLANGHIYETEKPTVDTLCSMCGKVERGHGNLKNYTGPTANKMTGEAILPHNFTPAKFVHVNSEIDNSLMKQYKDLFQNPDNIYGSKVKDIIGPMMIKDGHDFSAIRHICIFGFPDTFQALIQLFGRGIRKKSHLALMPAERNVMIHIYVNCYADDTTPERYPLKFENFLEIQNINKLHDQMALDRELYDPDTPVPTTQEVFRFYTQNLYHDEVNTLIYVIKKLFMLRVIWSHDDLIAAIRDPAGNLIPFQISVNICESSDQVINYVLESLIYHRDVKQYLQSSERVLSQNTPSGLLFITNKYCKFFIRGGTLHVITAKKLDKMYYVLTPIDTDSKSLVMQPLFRPPLIEYKLPFSDIEYLNLNSVKNFDKSVFLRFKPSVQLAAIKNHLERNSGHPMIDFYRKYHVIKGRNIYTNHEVLSFDGNEWIGTPRSHQPYGPVIGYYKDGEFKVMAGEITKHRDRRNMDRGGTCNTRSHQELERIIKVYDIQINLHKKSICESIEDKLLSLHLHDTSKTYFFFFGSPP